MFVKETYDNRLKHEVNILITPRRKKMVLD